jgi:hypothetical protein
MRQGFGRIFQKSLVLYEGTWEDDLPEKEGALTFF